MGQALQLGAQLGSLGHLNFLLPLQLPLPLIEVMENEALEILTKAFRSEPYPQLPLQTLGDCAGLGSVGVGFRAVSAS